MTSLVHTNFYLNTVTITIESSNNSSWNYVHRHYQIHVQSGDLVPLPSVTLNCMSYVSICKTPHLSMTTGLPQKNLRSQETTVAKTLIYPVMCQFHIFVALCDHNPPKLQTDKQTDSEHFWYTLKQVVVVACLLWDLLWVARKQLSPPVT